MPDIDRELDRLLAYCSEGGRVFPVPMRWHELWELLPQRGSRPPLPLILSGWWHSSDRDKAGRLREHVLYAADQGVLDQVSTHIYALPEEDWHYGEGGELFSAVFDRDYAARVASEYLTSDGARVEGVSLGPVWDGAGDTQRITIYEAGFQLERCWGMFVKRASTGPWGIRSRDVILVSKDTGQVVYAGSAGEEG